jgi:hypothetical protein
MSSISDTVKVKAKVTQNDVLSRVGVRGEVVLNILWSISNPYVFFLGLR